MKPGTRRILLVEDNPGDLRLIAEALSQRGIDFELRHYEKADDAVRAIESCGRDGKALPELILVDYNLPCGDARDVLVAAAGNPMLAGVPRAVVTSSLAPQDREHALRLGARSFIYKPVTLDDFLEEVGSSVAALLDQRADTAGAD
jgi:CheY-like chemotaxis protein